MKLIYETTKPVDRRIWEYNGLLYQITTSSTWNLHGWAIGRPPLFSVGESNFLGVSNFTESGVIYKLDTPLDEIDPDAFFAELVL